MNFEVVSKEVDAQDHKAALSSGKLQDIYQVARPILVAVSKFNLLPKKWRTIVSGLVVALDAITGK